MYVPIQYPKWIDGVEVANEGEERAIVGDKFVPYVHDYTIDPAEGARETLVYPKWVVDREVHSAEEEAALLESVTAPTVVTEEAPVQRGRK